MKPDAFSVKLGKNLYQLRKRRDLSAERVADMMDITTDSVYKYEHGERMFSVKMLVRTARVLHTSCMSILDGLNDEDLMDVPSNREYNILPPNASIILRNLATKWTGDIEALIVFMGMIAAFPEEERREIYMQGIITKDRLISRGVLPEEALPPGMDHMESALGALYNK